MGRQKTGEGETDGRPGEKLRAGKKKKAREEEGHTGVVQQHQGTMAAEKKTAVIF